MFDETKWRLHDLYFETKLYRLCFSLFSLKCGHDVHGQNNNCPNGIMGLVVLGVEFYSFYIVVR